MSFPAYPQYSASYIDYLGALPEHWWAVPLKRLATVRNGRDYKEVEEASGPYPVIGSGGEFARASSYLYSGDSVLFGRKGTVDRPLLISGSFWTVDTMFYTEVYRTTDPRFLFYAGSIIPFGRISTNTALPSVAQEDLSETYLPQPTLIEQKVIADFLDHETDQIDALIEEQQRLVKLLSEERDARITHAVTRGLDTSTSTRDSGLDWLGDIPAHWEVRKISTVTDKVTNGYVGPTRGVLKDSGVRYLQSLHIKRNNIIFDPPYYVDEQWSQNHNKSILREGDVLVVQTGDIGQVAYVSEEFAGSNCHALIILSPINNVLEGRFLSWVLNSSYGFNSLKSVQTGALHPHLNCGYVRDIYIPLPPVQEQTEIARYIDETEREFDGLVGQIRSGESLLKERRSAVISAAVTGKIDVREWRQPTPSAEAIVPQVAEKEDRYG